MIQTENFKMRISPRDRAMLAYVAKQIQRTESDTIRVIVREFYQTVKASKADERKAISKTAAVA